MMNRLIRQIFHIGVWIIIAMGVLYIFFKLTEPQNSLTYNFSNANHVITDALGFFSNTNSEMKIYFDTSNIEDRQPCCFFINFENKHGEITLGDMNDDGAMISITHRFEADYNEIDNINENGYVILFFPEDQEDYIVNFWGGMCDYSFVASLRDDAMDLIEDNSLLLYTDVINDQYIQNALDIYSGCDLKITGDLGLCELNNFIIYELKRETGDCKKFCVNHI